MKKKTAPGAGSKRLAPSSSPWDEFAPKDSPAERPEGIPRKVRGWKGPAAPSAVDRAFYLEYLQMIRGIAQRELAEEHAEGSNRAKSATAAKHELVSIAQAITDLAGRLHHGPMSGEIEELRDRPDLMQCIRTLPELATAVLSLPGVHAAPHKRYAASSVAGLYVSLRHRFGLACSSTASGPAVLELRQLFDDAGWAKLYGKEPSEENVSRLIAAVLAEFDPHQPVLSRFDCP